MYRVLVLFFISFLCSIQTNSQEYIFNDTFEKKNTNWKQFYMYHTTSNEKNFLKVKQKNARYRPVVDKTILRYGIFNFSQNFILESKMKIDSGVGEYGIVFDFNNLSNYKVFKIRGNSYSIVEVKNGKEINLESYVTSSVINGRFYENIFRIEKTFKLTNFYINNKLVTRSKITYSNHNTKVGLFLSQQNQGSWSYLKVDYYYLKKGELIENSSIVDNQPPIITIISPNVNRGFSIVKNTKSTTITGTINDESKIYEVLINGQEASVDTNGNFSKNVILGIGENTFTVKATDVKMNSTTKTFTIKREVEQKETVVVNNNKDQNNSSTLKTGKYYALIIGNNEYKDQAIASLDEPIKDATKLYNVLTSKYAFSPQNVTLLKNATYVQMIDALDQLSNSLTRNDNLLVFYAGHGYWDTTKKLGYWLPSNAKKKSTAFWIRNSTISDYMASIKTKHTLLIADACFSGSIFKTRSAFDNAPLAVKKLNDLPSKKAMTSGNLKEVPDQSVFLKYLVQRLNENTEKYLPADKLFSSFRRAVLANSPNAPQFGTIQNAGDEGGEFIFVKKN